MPVEMFARHMTDGGPKPRMKITRHVRRLVRSERDPGRWWLRPLKADGGSIGGIRVLICSDGPYTDDLLHQYLIGRVVGIYNPAAIGGAA